MLLLLPPSSVTIDTRHNLLELARFLTELSVIDYYFVIHHPSTVALAALLNAVDEIPGASQEIARDLLWELNEVSGLQTEGEELTACRSRLRLLYAQGGYSHPSAAATDSRTETESPVCVSFGCTPYHSAPTAPDRSLAAAKTTSEIGHPSLATTELRG
jgi:hypothetical protein